MKLIEKVAKKFTKTASNTVKTEVKKTAIDLLPAVIGFVSMVVGVLLFHETMDIQNEVKPSITNRNTCITTNNYFFRDLSEEAIRKVLEEGKR